ncbi:hypothetical protein [Streptosporangium sp. 'caverna']|uniref:hypothetical protein n=1 Tax=Streptosporangium sp. 'caverna' TaxID=2202249 RepID=UPI0019550C4B|nr:hypothetical protein [Streptosporangium sp. 'caverna']
MSTSNADAVTFSDLSRNPRAVAERAVRLGRVRITHRDAPDFYLTAADREDQRGQTPATASRLFLALIKHDPTARTLVIAVPPSSSTRRPHECDSHRFTWSAPCPRAPRRAARTSATAAVPFHGPAFSRRAFEPWA